MYSRFLHSFPESLSTFQSQKLEVGSIIRSRAFDCSDRLFVCYLDIPIVGIAMRLARHVFLRRNDIKSALESTDVVIQRLKEGNSMVLFAEGTRSLDGRLQT